MRKQSKKQSKAQQFPKVKGLYKKRTASGFRYVLHGSQTVDGRLKDYFVTVPIEDGDTLAVFWKTIETAQDELDMKMHPEAPVPKPRDIAYYIEQYAHKRSLSQGSVWQYHHALKGFTMDADANDARVAEILARDDLKDSSKKRIVGIVNTFFKYLVQTGVAKRNPAAGVRVGRWQRRTRLPTPDEIERITSYTDTNGNAEDALFLRLLIATGARCSTIECLHVGDLSSDHHISLYNVKTRKKYSSDILITDPVIIQLWDEVASDRARTEYLFGANGDPVKVSRRLRCRMLRLFDADDDGQRISPHSFRHLFGCNLLAKGVPMETIASLMDHQTLSVTYQYYARPKQDALDSAIKTLGNGEVPF